MDFCLCLFRWVFGFLRFDGLCVCVCVCGSVCVVMGLDRLIGVSWVKWWIGMVGRGYFLGIFWHGGTFFWVFSMLIGVSGVKSAFFWAFF